MFEASFKVHQISQRVHTRTLTRNRDKRRNFEGMKQHRQIDEELHTNTDTCMIDYP